jgi:hypothetical protein
MVWLKEIAIFYKNSGCDPALQRRLPMIYRHNPFFFPSFAIKLIGLAENAAFTQ